MANQRADVVVIGGGISGLSCAAFAHADGLDVRVLERSDTVGGVIRTMREDGYLSEDGPNSTLDGKPALARLIALLNLSDHAIYANEEAKKRYVLRDGTLHALPMSPPGLLSSKLFSFGGRLRALREPFIRRGGGNGESLASFIERRFGREILDYAIDPFVSGVYAGDPSQLGVQAAFGMLVDYEREHGSVIRGAIRAAKERKRAGGGRPQMLSFDNGMDTLTGAIASQLGDSIVTGATCTGIERDPDGWRVHVVRDGTAEVSPCRAVVIAVPADAAAELLQPLDVEVASSLRDVPYAPIASVFLGYARDRIVHPLDGFGFLVPSRERRDLLGVIFSSSLYPNRAPDGSVAITAFAGGVRRSDIVDLDDESLVALVRRELNTRLGESGDPAVVRVRRWKRAIPQYAPGHERLDARVGELTRSHTGMYVCSNFCGGVSVADCIESGDVTATAIKSALTASV